MTALDFLRNDLLENTAEGDDYPDVSYGRIAEIMDKYVQYVRSPEYEVARIKLGWPGLPDLTIPDSSTLPKIVGEKEPVSSTEFPVYFTDGSCDPNPGPGAWSFVCVHPRRWDVGIDPRTTNNRMEMMAVLGAFDDAMKHGAKKVKVHSDSQYVVKGFNEWMAGWQKKHWMKAGKYIPNHDIWIKFWAIREKLVLQWVRGHDTSPLNNKADELAGKALRDWKRSKRGK